MVTRERYSSWVEAGAQEWQRRRADRRLRDERRPLEPRLEPPAVPADLLDSERWESTDAHLAAIHTWIGDDQAVLLADAADSIEEMTAIRRFAASGHGTGDQDGVRSELLATLRHAKYDSPRFDHLDHAIEVARPRCTEWSVDRFRWHFGNFPTRLIPVALYLLSADMSDDTLARLIFPTWKWAGNPEKYVKRSQWRALYRRAGFTVDGKPADRPTGGPLVMYRAADHENRFNFSWTSNQWLAVMYAGMRRAQYDRYGTPKDIRIWRMAVPVENLLAHGNAGGEWVVDTSQLGNLGHSLPIRPIDEPTTRRTA